MCGRRRRVDEAVGPFSESKCYHSEPASPTPRTAPRAVPRSARWSMLSAWTCRAMSMPAKSPSSKPWRNAGGTRRASSEPLHELNPLRLAFIEERASLARCEGARCRLRRRHSLRGDGAQGRARPRDRYGASRIRSAELHALESRRDELTIAHVAAEDLARDSTRALRRHHLHGNARACARNRST